MVDLAVKCSSKDKVSNCQNCTVLTDSEMVAYGC